MKALLCSCLVATSAYADVVSIDPVGGALGFTGKNLGDWSISYERELGTRHAVLVEQTTVHVHEAPFHLTNFGLGIGYRYFWDGPFVGGIVGGKLGTGRVDLDPEMKLSGKSAYATAHAGWRWTTGKLVITARIGAGYAYYSIDADDHLRPLPFEVDSELSVGWKF